MPQGRSLTLFDQKRPALPLRSGRFSLRVPGAGFRSLTENIDTTTPAGRMMMQMVGAFAEFERPMIWERTSAGLAAARAEGRVRYVLYAEESHRGQTAVMTKSGKNQIVDGNDERNVQR